MIENVFERDGSFVNQHADGKSKAAKRHDVDGLAEPGQGSKRNRMERGMEMMMIIVERQLPRKSKIITPTSAAASSPSRSTPKMAALTNTDWSPTACRFDAGGQGLLDPRQQSLDPVDDVESRDRTGLQNRHQHGLDPIDSHHIGLRGEPSWT